MDKKKVGEQRYFFYEFGHLKYFKGGIPKKHFNHKTVWVNSGGEDSINSLKSISSANNP